jgi:elongation factor Ts
MATITAAMVKELRERTELGMLECRNALVEANGDPQKAYEILMTKSAAKAAKKADRTTSEGLLGVKVAEDGSRAAMVEINVETDFAQKNPQFVAFVERVVDVVFDSRESDVAKLLAGPLGVERERLVQGIGENVTIRRASVLAAPKGRVAGYLHTDNRQGALVALEGGDAALARDVAMHVTAAKPRVVAAADVPADELESKRGEFRAQAAESGKPPAIVEKMIEGRVRKFLEEIALVDQPYVKQDDKRVGQLLKEHNARCTGFVHFVVGEGIVKETKDFAAEVAAQVKGDSRSRR